MAALNKVTSSSRTLACCPEAMFGGFAAGVRADMEFGATADERVDRYLLMGELARGPASTDEPAGADADAGERCSNKAFRGKIHVNNRQAQRRT